jgi:threonine dehydratase
MATSSANQHDRPLWNVPPRYRLRWEAFRRHVMEGNGAPKPRTMGVVSSAAAKRRRPCHKRLSSRARNQCSQCSQCRVCAGLARSQAQRRRQCRQFVPCRPTRRRQATVARKRSKSVLSGNPQARSADATRGSNRISSGTGGGAAVGCALNRRLPLPTLPSYDDVAAAARRLEGHAQRTPVLRSRTIDEVLGASLFFKCENFQRMGAFKFRGAFNALSRFDAPQRQAGVVAFSSGNHAQAVALSARLLGIPATIVMPHDAPAAKVAATRGYGGSVVFYDRYTEDREAIGSRLAEQHGLTLVPPYDHVDVIAGQGTAAKELLDEVGPLDALYVCLGGGGLLSGSALAARALSPTTRLYGVEPEAGNDGQQSFRSGSIVHIDTPKTIADGAQTQHLGKLTFDIIRRDVDDILTASDTELIECMRFFAERMKIVVEPTGCLGFAAARRHAQPGQRVGVIVSGGNVDLQRFAALLAG